MSRIRVLDPVVVDQIAAGEVVERPASVVKELVENAIDAGARRIEVRLEEGGLRRIEVRDDGHGIAAEELGRAVASHATSKLERPEDLESIATLGFRGEALASIAAVSRLTLVSRPRDAASGATIRVRYGRVEAPAEEAAAFGTRVIVEDLFGELPARRKFLKQPATEAAHAAAWVERLALAHPEIGFRCEHGDRVLLDAAPGEELAARCAAVFGRAVAERMVAIERRDDALLLQARIGPPESARRDAQRAYVFLNGRWVRDPRLQRAVREGVKEFVPIGHWPALVLMLALPPDRVDVNVHPQKTEVRLRDERFVLGTIITALRAGLARAPWATRSVGELGGSARLAEPTAAPQAWRAALAELPPPAAAFGAVAAGAASAAAAAPAPAAALPWVERPHEEREVGPMLSVARTFLVREVPGGMEILDQHALHERVNLEELRAEVRSGRVVMQPLLVPALVDVTREEADALLRHRETFLQLGVDLDAFGPVTIALRGVPARLTRLRPEALVDDLLEIAREERDASPERLQEEMLFRMSCRGAVMAGDRLDADALQSLLRRGAHLPQDRTCAHGRPVRVFLTLADLERAFHRR
jgi:DNA mismatch repair protein MutL